MAWNRTLAVSDDVHDSGTNSDLTALVCAKPAHAAGDWLIAFWGCAGTSGVVAVVTDDDGGTWELIASRTGSGGSPAFYAKRVTAVETGNVRFKASHTDPARAGAWCHVQIKTYRGGPSTISTAIVLSASEGGSSGLGIPRAPALALDAPGFDGLLVIRGGQKNRNASKAGGIAALSPFTKIDEGTGSSQLMFVWEDYVQTTHANISNGTWVLDTNDLSAVSSCGLVVAIKAGSGSVLSITSVGGDNSVTSTETNVSIVTANADATQGVVTISHVASGISQVQPIVDWATSLIRINITQGNLPYGTDLVLTVARGDSQQASRTITLVAPSGKAYTVCASASVVTSDANNNPSRFYDVPDVAVGDQVERATTQGTGSTDMDTDLTMEADATVRQNGFRVWKPLTGWTAQSLWDWRGLPPRCVLKSVPEITIQQGSAITPTSFRARFVDGDTPSPVFSLVPVRDGLTMNASTASLSGTPLTFGSTLHRVYCIDEDGSEAFTDQFPITATAPPILPSILVQPIDLIHEVGQPIPEIDLTGYFSGYGDIGLDGVFPPGIEFDEVLFKLSGIPNLSGIYPNLRFSASNGAGTIYTIPFIWEILTETAEVPDMEPDLDGSNSITLAAAIALLDPLSLTYSVTYEASTIPAGNVIRQGVAAGTSVAVGAQIPLVVSLGSEEPVTGVLSYQINPSPDGKLYFEYPDGDHP
jgi:hypothetical protein